MAPPVALSQQAMDYSGGVLVADGRELAEDVDLAPERRRYISDVHDRLEELSFYELLGIPRDADRKAIKRAYFDLVGLVHPDRHFGKKLGGYRFKMEAILRRLTEAHETLTSESRRRGYDASLGRAPAKAAVPSMPVDPRLAARRKEAAEAIRQRLLDAQQKAKPHVEAAERARANRDYGKAAEEYRLALTLTPRDAALQAALEEVRRAAEGRNADSLSRQAALEERFGRFQEAAESWRRASQAKPEDAAIRDRLAQALERAKRGG